MSRINNQPDMGASLSDAKTTIFLKNEKGSCSFSDQLNNLINMAESIIHEDPYLISSCCKNDIQNFAKRLISIVDTLEEIAIDANVPLSTQHSTDENLACIGCGRIGCFGKGIIPCDDDC